MSSVREFETNDPAGEFIRARRKELGMTIREISKLAYIGEKTWSSYESGKTVRVSNYRPMCVALQVEDFPCLNSILVDSQAKLAHLKGCDHLWYKPLENSHGEMAAASIAYGLEMLKDAIDETQMLLDTYPNAKTLGGVRSVLLHYLSVFYLDRYDRTFLQNMRISYDNVTRAIQKEDLVANTVMEEMVVWMAWNIFAHSDYVEGFRAACHGYIADEKEAKKLYEEPGTNIDPFNNIFWWMAADSIIKDYNFEPALGLWAREEPRVGTRYNFDSWMGQRVK